MKMFYTLSVVLTILHVLLFVKNLGIVHLKVAILLNVNNDLKECGAWQKRRYRYKELTFGLSGRRRGWDDLSE